MPASLNSQLKNWEQDLGWKKKSGRQAIGILHEFAKRSATEAPIAETEGRTRTGTMGIEQSGDPDLLTSLSMPPRTK